MSENDATPEITPAPAQPETSQGTQDNNTEGTTDKLLTQAEVDRIVGDRVKRATEAATNKLLETLGLSSVDEAKATIEAEKKRKEAEMTELEKKDLRIQALEQKFNEQVAATEQLQQQRLNDLRDNGLLQLLDKAYDRSSALILIKAKHAARMEALISEDGTFNDKEAQKLIEDFQKENAVLFQSGAPGSPSNNNGRTPDTNKQAKELAKSASIKRLRRNV